MTETNYMNKEFHQSSSNNNISSTNNRNMEYVDFNTASYGAYPYESNNNKNNNAATTSAANIGSTSDQQQMYSYNPGLYTMIDDQQQNNMNTINNQNSYFPYTQTLQPYMWMPPYQQNQFYQPQQQPQQQQQFGYTPYSYTQQSPYSYNQEYSQYYTSNPNYFHRNTLSGQGNEIINNIQKQELVNDISPLSPRFAQQQQQQQNYNNSYITHSNDINQPYLNPADMKKSPKQKLSKPKQPVNPLSIPKAVYNGVPRAGGIYGITLDNNERAELLQFLKQRRAQSSTFKTNGDSSNRLNEGAFKTKNDFLWSENISLALDVAITSIPKDDFNRIRLASKQYGRNELIALYIYVVTGEKRKIKQISSHLQVWKKRLIKDLNKTTEIMKSKKIGKYGPKEKKEDGDDEEEEGENKEENETKKNNFNIPNGNNNIEFDISKRNKENIDIIDLETGEVVSERDNKPQNYAHMKESERLLKDFNTKVFLSKNKLETDEDILYFFKMSTLIYYLLEYGIVKNEYSMLRFKDVFFEIEQMLAKGLIDKI